MIFLDLIISLLGAISCGLRFIETLRNIHHLVCFRLALSYRGISKGSDIGTIGLKTIGSGVKDKFTILIFIMISGSNVV